MHALFIASSSAWKIEQQLCSLYFLVVVSSLLGLMMTKAAPTELSCLLPSVYISVACDKSSSFSSVWFSASLYVIPDRSEG